MLTPDGFTCEVPNCGRAAVRPRGEWAPWSCDEHWEDFVAWKKEKDEQRERDRLASRAQLDRASD